MLTTRNPESFLILLFLLVVVQVLTSRLFGGDYFLFSVSANYLPILGIGASFAIVEIKKSWSTSLYLWIPTYFATFIFATKNFYPNFLKSGDSYPMSLVYAIFIFAILYGKNRSWHTHFLIKYVAKWSYSIYLVHMLIATLIVTRFLKMTGFTAAIAIALAFIGLFAFLYERVIERPSRRIGDIVLKKYR